MDLDLKEFRTTNTDHVPYMKTVYQVKEGTCVMEVWDYTGNVPGSDPWTEITLHEAYTPSGSDRTIRKSISMTLNETQRELFFKTFDGRVVGEKE